MLKIGLTGGIGSGKSVVRDMLAEKGARIFDADAVAKRLMVSDAQVKAGLLRVLGPEAWDADGSLNKPWISRRIFGNSSLRAEVNDIVHPAVHEAFDQHARQAEREGVPAIVREAALLPHATQRNELDRIVAVIAPKAMRIKRVLDRDGLTLSEIEKRMAAQPDDMAYAAFSDDVIRNEGTLIELKRQVGQLWASWMSESGNPTHQTPESEA